MGISGIEGDQAAKSADYSIAQFCFLRRLLLVHGHLCFARTSKLIQYSLHKNLVFILPQFLFLFYSASSAQVCTCRSPLVPTSAKDPPTSASLPSAPPAPPPVMRAFDRRPKLRRTLQLMYDGQLASLFNVFFSALPIVAVALFDTECNQILLFHLPKL